MSSHQIVSALCKDCEYLTSDVLSANFPSARWQKYDTFATSILKLENHHESRIVSLTESSQQGCNLCTHIACEVQKLEPSLSQSDYYIFIYKLERRQSKVELGLGPLDTLLKAFDQRPRYTAIHFRVEDADARIISKNEIVYYVENVHPYVSSLPFRNLGSPMAMQQANQWLQECISTHKGCSRRGWRLPKRVLKLDKTDDRLVISLYITHRENQPYAALSYTWGPTDRLVSRRRAASNTVAHEALDDIVVVRKKSKSASTDRQSGRDLTESWEPSDIPMQAFPATIRDALTIADALGFSYLWVDSLCILQGDSEDWEDQNKEMADIYGQSQLVISASSTRSTEDGILHDMTYDGTKIGIWRSRGGEQIAHRVFVSNSPKIIDLEQQYTSTRGWIFQERLVSPATLHFTVDGMVWECASQTKVSHVQGHTAMPWKKNWQMFVINHPAKAPHTERNMQLSSESRFINSLWYGWITAYSARTLSYSSDKLPAVAGIAKQLAAKFDVKYAAGLWNPFFVNGLLWRRHNKLPTLTRYRDNYIAPSWSWASVEGRLEFRDVLLSESIARNEDLLIMSIDVVEKHSGTFGELVGSPGKKASIRVRGVLQAVTVDRFYHPTARQKAWSECGFSAGFRNMENVMCCLDEWSDSDAQYLDCWCLRIGSFVEDGRRGVCFLVLARGDEDNVYRRIGYAEAEPWWDRMRESLFCGVLADPAIPQEMCIV